jgi:protein TonB
VRVLVMLAAAAVMAAPDDAPVAAQADYRQWPSAYDWYLATPTLVHSRGLTGRAVLLCKVNDFGDLARCKVVEEDPKGFGLGRAAMRLRSKVRMVPTPKGQERWLRIPFKWGERGPYLPPTL